MRHPLAVPLLALLAVPASAPPIAAAPATRAAHMDEYLSIWSRNDAVTPATVARLYARRVDYYGHRMSAEGVYRDKLAFVRRWPVRAYAAVPGTVRNDCTDESARCRVSAAMHWSRADRAGRRDSGTNSLRLDLAREGGALKIVRERGEPLAR